MKFRWLVLFALSLVLGAGGITMARAMTEPRGDDTTATEGSPAQGVEPAQDPPSQPASAAVLTAKRDW